MMLKGYVLEASPLPKLPVIGLEHVLGPKAPLHLILDHQSREDEDINGNDTNVQYEVGFLRYPFVLLLDGIVSPPGLQISVHELWRFSTSGSGSISDKFFSLIQGI